MSTPTTTSVRDSGRRGNAAVAMLIALAIIQLSVAALVLGGSRDQDLAVQRLGAVRSFYAAEAAANMSMRELARSTDFDADGVIGSISADGNPGTDPLLGGSRLSSTASTTGPTTTINVLGASNQAARRATLSLTAAAVSQGWAGVLAEFFTAPANVSMTTQVNWNAAPIAVGLMPDFNFPNQSSSTPRYASGPTANFGVRMRATLAVPTAGSWTFTLTSDDGSTLAINGVQRINNDGLHSPAARTYTASLTQGNLDLDVRWFERSGGNALILAWSGPGFPSATVIPQRYLSAPVTTLPHLAVNTTLQINGDGTAESAAIDAFNPAAGAYGGQNVLLAAARASTNSTAAQAIALTNQGRLNGSASVGPGGNTSTAISTSGGAAITGSTSVLPQRVAVLRPSPATTPGSSGALVLNASATWNSTRRYTSVQINGDATVLTISGHITVVVDGAFQINNAARIEIVGDSSLSVFAGGAVSFNASSQVNTNTGSPDRAIFVLTGANQTLALAGTSRVAANIWNPGGPVTLNGVGAPGSQLYGRVYANSFLMNANSRLHLASPAAAGAGGAFTIASWSETR